MCIEVFLPTCRQPLGGFTEDYETGGKGGAELGQSGVIQDQRAVYDEPEPFHCQTYARHDQIH